MFVILTFYSGCVPTVVKHCISKDCRIFMEFQRSTWCLEKAWLSPGNVRIICDTISGPGPTSFGYHGLATVPFTPLHCENSCGCPENCNESRFETASWWHGKTFTSRVIDIRPGQVLMHKIIITSTCRFLGVTRVRSNDGVGMDTGGCLFRLGTE